MSTPFDELILFRKKKLCCTRGHVWTEPAFTTSYWSRPDGKRVCNECLTEFIAQHCGIVEEVPADFVWSKPEVTGTSNAWTVLRQSPEGQLEWVQVPVDIDQDYEAACKEMEQRLAEYFGLPDPLGRDEEQGKSKQKAVSVKWRKEAARLDRENEPYGGQPMQKQLIAGNSIAASKGKIQVLKGFGADDKPILTTLAEEAYLCQAEPPEAPERRGISAEHWNKVFAAAESLAKVPIPWVRLPASNMDDVMIDLANAEPESEPPPAESWRDRPALL